MTSRRLDAWYRANAQVAVRRWRPVEGASALDLLHDAVVDLLERPVASVRSPVGYLLAAARSLTLDRRRRVATAARAQEELRLHARSVEEVVGRGASSELDGDLLAALEALPQACRTALILNRLEGMTHREVAAHQGTSVRTVRRRIDQALALLLEVLGDREG